MSDIDMEKIRVGLLKSFHIPIDDNRSVSSKNVNITTEVEEGTEIIVVKSYYHKLLCISRSQGPYKTVSSDITFELESGALEKVLDVYIYPQAKKTSRDYTYMTTKRKIWISIVNRKDFKHLVAKFPIYAEYYQKQNYSLLPNILGLIRLSEKSNLKSSKRYFIVFQSLYPYRTHHKLCYSLFADSQKAMYWSVSSDTISPPSSSRLLVPLSYEAQSYRSVNDDYWLDVDDDKKDIIWKQSIEDLHILSKIGLFGYCLLIVGAERDKMFGNLFLPGEVFGREREEDRDLSLERKNTLIARHDVYTETALDQVLGASLLPISIVKDEVTLLEYYFSFAYIVHPDSSKSNVRFWPFGLNTSRYADHIANMIHKYVLRT